MAISESKTGFILIKIQANVSDFEPFLSDFTVTGWFDAFWDDAADHRSAGITLAGIFSAAI